MPAIATPGTSISSINNLMLIIRKIDPPYTYKNLEDFIDLSPSVISITLSAAREIGLAKSAGIRGSYEFTSQGREYAIELSYGNTERAGEILLKIIDENSKWIDILEFLNRQIGIPFDPYDLVRYVERRLGKK